MRLRPGPMSCRVLVIAQIVLAERRRYANEPSLKERFLDLPVRDAWGRSILHRCPGPVQENGYDSISCGPNGVHEEGGGDDLVRGEDAPGGIAAIASNPR